MYTLLSKSAYICSLCQHVLAFYIHAVFSLIYMYVYIHTDMPTYIYIHAYTYMYVHAMYCVITHTSLTQGTYVCMYVHVECGACKQLVHEVWLYAHM